MKDLRQQLHQLNYFSKKQLINLWFSATQMHQRLLRETKKKTILTIKSWIYVTQQRIHDLTLTKQLPTRQMYIACEVINPEAYISLESALALHQVIPEMVTATTCISQKRPYQYHTPWWLISYRNINKSMFRGFAVTVRDNMLLRIAHPEKALLDRLRLRSDIIREESWFESLRIETESLDLWKIKQYVLKINRWKINKVLVFLEMLRW